MSHKNTRAVLCLGIVAAGLAAQHPARAAFGWAYTPNGFSQPFAPTTSGLGSFVYWTSEGSSGGTIANSNILLTTLANALPSLNSSSSIQGQYYVSCGADWQDLATHVESSTLPTSGVEFSSTVSWMTMSAAAASYTTSGGVWTGNTGTASGTVTGALGGHGNLFATDSAQGLTGGMNSTSPTPQPFGGTGSATSTSLTPPSALGNLTATNGVVRGRGGVALYVGGVLKWGSNVDMGMGFYAEQLSFPSSFFVGNSRRFIFQEAPGANFNNSTTAYNGSAAISFAYGQAALAANPIP